MPSVAVIGAGMAGLTCARGLADHGLDVTVFEKGRGIGGRMATRRTADGLRFDHGAQYFTVRSERFQRQVSSWIDQGLVERWSGAIGVYEHGRWEAKQSSPDRFVAVPAMNSVCRHLASDLDVCLQARIAAPRREGDAWQIADEADRPLGRFDYVVVSAPAPQAAELLAGCPPLAAAARRIPMDGCWAGLVALAEPICPGRDGAFVHDSPLAWIARNGSKPRRPDGPDCWVLHARPDWTRDNLEREDDDVLAELLAAFWQATGLTPREPSYATAHRWRYALPPEPHAERSLFDADLRIGACGDWCGGPRVEGAFLSGTALADRLLRHCRD